MAYDPIKDPIKLVREGDKLHADGTSLGADDGMGIAIIVYIMKNLQSHGPIRAIITVDEEAGMTGSINCLDKFRATVRIDSVVAAVIGDEHLLQMVALSDTDGDTQHDTIAK